MQASKVASDKRQASLLFVFTTCTLHSTTTVLQVLYDTELPTVLLCVLKQKPRSFGFWRQSSVTGGGMTNFNFFINSKNATRNEIGNLKMER